MLKRNTLRESTQGYGNVNETLICKRFNACLDRFEYEYTIRQTLGRQVNNLFHYVTTLMRNSTQNAESI